MKIFPSIHCEREHLSFFFLALLELQSNYHELCVGKYFIYKWYHNCARHRNIYARFRIKSYCDTTEPLPAFANVR